MSLRRSARAASAKPADGPAAATRSAAKPAAKSATKAGAKGTTKASPKEAPRFAAKAVAKATKPAEKADAKAATRRKAATKRPASPENAPPPPSKRARTAAAPKVVANGVSHVNGKAEPAEPAPAKKRKTSVPPKEKKVLPQLLPYFNPLPTAPEHTRPSPTLFVWGAGNFGQFGMGADVLGDFEKPRKNDWVESKKAGDIFGSEGASFESVAAGGLHSMFVDENGIVWSCGVNDDGALGRVTTNVPNPDKPGEFLDIDELTAEPHPLQSLRDERFRAVRIAAGDTISAAISNEGRLRVWGTFRGIEGVLGFSSGHKHQFLPAALAELTAELKSKPGDVEKFTSVAAGNNHLLVLTTHGNLFTWGAGEQGQLGRKVLERRKIHGTAPEKIVLGARSTKARIVGAGNYASFAVDEHGNVWAWGLNNMGQLGTGFSSASVDGEVQQPKKVIGLSAEELDGDRVVQIAGGEHHTLFLTGRGKVYSCGRSDGGQLGLDEEHKAVKESEHKDMVAEPTLVPFPDADDPVIQIAAGIHNNAAVTAGGALYTWGTGVQGELGISGETEVNKPTVVVRREGGSWAALSASCGGQHTLALFKKKT